MRAMAESSWGSRRLRTTALSIGAMFPIIHLGRPWLAFWLFPRGGDSEDQVAAVSEEEPAADQQDPIPAPVVETAVSTSWSYSPFDQPA